MDGKLFSKLSFFKLRGPFLTIALVAVIQFLSQATHRTYIPDAFFLITVVYSVVSGGIKSGLISTLIVLFYSLYYYQSGTKPFFYTNDTIIHLIILFLSLPTIIKTTEILKRQAEGFSKEKEGREEAEKTAEKLRRLQWITDATLTHLSLKDLLSELLIRTKTLLNVDTIGIFLLQQDGLTLIKWAGKGIEKADINPKPLKLGEGVIGKVAENKKPLIIYKLSQSSIKGSRLEELGITSVVALPLLSEGKLIGVMHVGTKKPRRFTKDDIELLQLGADRASTAIDRAYQYHQAQEAIRARDEFLSIASHELRTPLTSMILQLQTVLRSVQEQSLATFSIEKMVKMLENAEHQSIRLGKIIKDLLNVSLISSGKIDLDIQNADIVHLAKMVVTSFEKQSELARSPLKFTADKQIMANVDPIRLEQVFTNLISNALKYGKGKPIVIRLTKNSDAWVFSVSDQGIGIPKEKIAAIFDRFSRAVSAKEYKGLGVGLYITNQIIKALKGTITVESEDGKGTTFTLTIPLNPEEKTNEQK